MLVDLFTRNKTLTDIMITDYPERIDPEKQYKVDEFGGDKVYCFFGLDARTLRVFLKDKKIYEYEIRAQGTGAFLEINVIGNN